MNDILWKKQDLKTMKYSKNVLMKGLILFTAINKTYAVLNLLIIHGKDIIDSITFLLVK